MAKTHTTLSIDPDVLKKAKKMNVNMSGEFSDFLRKRIMPRKRDLSDENLRMQCGNCGKIVNDGYLCEITRKFWCYECERKGRKCILEEHEHWRIPTLDGSRKEIANELHINSENIDQEASNNP